MNDPTAAAIEARNVERAQLRNEIECLTRDLAEARTEIEILRADRDATARGRDEIERNRDAEHGRAELCAQDARGAHAEIARLKASADEQFSQGYDQAVREIRDHFAQAKAVDTVGEIEKIWLRKEQR